jgi:methanogenic corrinoid protein MtbC1
MNPNQLAADTLEIHARKIADLACADLLASHADIDERFGSEADELWNDHLRQRLLELAAAVEANDYHLFTSSLAWSRSAMQARGLTSKDLDLGIKALRTAIRSRTDGDVKNIAIDFIDQATKALAKGVPSNMDSRLDAGVALDRLALQYVQTVVAGNTRQAIQLVLDVVAQGTSVPDAYLRVLLPAQQEVGRLWHLNKLSVSEEHLVSYTTQRLMAMLSGLATPKDDNGLTVIAGSVVGNVHDIGIRAITYLLELEGWRTIYLGSDIPQEELPEAIDTFKADVLMLSVALTPQLLATTRVIAAVRRHSEQPVKILVGGNALSGDAKVWQQTGADAYATNANTALQRAYQLATGNMDV